MATKIRLTRTGKKGSPTYRIVVSDSRKARDGEIIEQLGFYNPLTNPVTVKIDEKKAKEWLAKGAQLTDTVSSIFKKQGIELPVKKPVKKPAKKPAAVKAAEAVKPATTSKKTASKKA